jgi:hypothetical protein
MEITWEIWTGLAAVLFLTPLLPWCHYEDTKQHREWLEEWSHYHEHYEIKSLSAKIANWKEY